MHLYLTFYLFYIVINLLDLLHYFFNNIILNLK